MPTQPWRAHADLSMSTYSIHCNVNYAKRQDAAAAQHFRQQSNSKDKRHHGDLSTSAGDQQLFTEQGQQQMINNTPFWLASSCQTAAAHHKVADVICSTSSTAAQLPLHQVDQVCVHSNRINASTSRQEVVHEGFPVLCLLIFSL
jgi:hypothetical protein